MLMCPDMKEFLPESIPIYMYIYTCTCSFTYFVILVQHFAYNFVIAYNWYFSKHNKVSEIQFIKYLHVLDIEWPAGNKAVTQTIGQLHEHRRDKTGPV